MTANKGVVCCVAVGRPWATVGNLLTHSELQFLHLCNK